MEEAAGATGRLQERACLALGAAEAGAEEEAAEEAEEAEEEAEEEAAEAEEDWRAAPGEREEQAPDRWSVRWSRLLEYHLLKE